MLDKSTLMKQLEKDVHDSEKQIKHMHLYNAKSYIMKKIIRSGIMIEYLLPYILASFIIYDAYSTHINTPLTKDLKEQKAKTETITTSTGIVKEKTSFDYDYNDKIIFEHTTPWELNEYGLFERTITSYRIEKYLEDEEIEDILSMSKEEIEAEFIITNIEKIQKNSLDIEDEFYNQEMLLITNIKDDENNIKIEEEPFIENAFYSLVYLGLVAISGRSIEEFKKIILKDKLKNLLKEKEKKYSTIKKEDLKKLKKILELKKENLLLLNDTEINEEYPRILKRK